MIKRKGLIPQIVECFGSLGQNRKDSYSNICGAATTIALSGLFLVKQGLLPDSISPYLVAVAGLSQIWVAYLTGKNPAMPVGDPRSDLHLQHDRQTDHARSTIGNREQK
jgi:hypothetical protein